MHAEHKVERTEHVFGGDDIGEGLVQIELLYAKPFDLPTRAPNVRCVGNAEGRVGRLLLFERSKVAAHSLAKVVGKGIIVERRGNGSDGPSDVRRVGDDMRVAFQYLLAVGFAASRH